MENKYKKENGSKELRKPIRTVINTVDNTKEQQINIDLTKSYQKEMGDLDPSLFVIISGGEKREKDYFDFFKNNSSSFPRIIIEFISENSSGERGLDVDKLVELAIIIKKEKDKSKESDITDSINLITDIDHFYSQIERNIPICEKNNLNLIISNPCFEIWLYYSYYDEIPDFNIPSDKLKISSKFKTYLNTKHSGGVNPKKAPLEINNAIKNSQANYSEDSKSIPNIFSTQMHIIASKLYELAKDELEIYKNKIKKDERKYKSSTPNK